MALYQKIELTGDKADSQIKNLRLYKGKFDAYCPECRKHTTWATVVSSDLGTRASREQMPTPLSSSLRASSEVTYNWMGDFVIRIECARSPSHRATFYFDTPGLSSFAIKIGQSPSITDFKLGDLSEFKQGMSIEQRREFVRATNAAAHGFNVAACIYYRRVFESVLLEASKEHMSKHGMDEWPEFKVARTDERIRLVKECLPQFMSEHPQLYGVLSLGVHELSEEQCAAELPMFRKAIELIMRDRVTVARQKR
jgi:hypothetical protein